jgi:hypothetical protein
MSKLRRKPGHRLKKKRQGHTHHASLAGFAPLIQSKGIFDAIHSRVHIKQKQIDYRPTDKLVFVVLGLLCGCESIDDINRKLRPDKPLLAAFGYDSCAEQSVIQQTLDRCTTGNVDQLHMALCSLYTSHNQSQHRLADAAESKPLTVDMDLMGLPASKKAEKSKKGYFAKKRGSYGRQLARVMIPSTQEIVTEGLYAGNRISCKVFKPMLAQMERQLAITDKQTRQSIRLRLDGGFGTDENINYALWLGYQVLVKMYSGNRAKKLAMSVEKWIDIDADEKGPRQAGWVTAPHRYGRTTRQIAIGKTNPKKKTGYTYVVVVTTDMNDSLKSLVKHYDKRSGMPESNFCQSNQGLNLRKLRKSGFMAQTMLILLSQLAHNLCRWMKRWMRNALLQKALMEANAKHLASAAALEAETNDSISTEIRLAIASIDERGIKRWVDQLLCISGEITVKRGRIRRLTFNAHTPLIRRFLLAFEILLKPYEVRIRAG